MLLAVELYATVVGTLEGDARSFDFTPTDDALNHFGANELGLGKSSLGGCQIPKPSSMKPLTSWHTQTVTR